MSYSCATAISVDIDRLPLVFASSQIQACLTAWQNSSNLCLQGFLLPSNKQSSCTPAKMGSMSAIPTSVHLLKIEKYVSIYSEIWYFTSNLAKYQLAAMSERASLFQQQLKNPCQILSCQYQKCRICAAISAQSSNQNWVSRTFTGKPRQHFVVILE